MSLCMLTVITRAEEVGHIQIKCEPNVQIYLDGDFQSVTREQLGGFIIQDVAPGKHVLTAVKEGYQPLKATIELSPNQVYTHEFNSFIPKFETYEEGDISHTDLTENTGKIIIQSLPVECTIKIPTLGVDSMNKTKDRRILDKVPSGTYAMEFFALGKMVQYELSLQPHETMRILVNFLKEEITTESELHEPQKVPVKSIQNGQMPDISMKQPEAPQAPPHNTIVANNAPPPGNILFFDDFEGRNKSRPKGWRCINAPSEEYWYLKDGDFSTGNGDKLTEHNGYSYAIINAPESENWRDYTVESTVWIRQSNGRALLLARWQDEDNHYEGVFESYEGDRYLKIQKVVSGTRNTLEMIKDGEAGRKIPKLEDGNSHDDAKKLIFTVSGSRLVLKLEDLVLEAKDESISKGSPGLGQWYNFVHFIDFKVLGEGAGYIPTPVSLHTTSPLIRESLNVADIEIPLEAPPMLQNPY